jgi:hypothetical protein
MVEKVVVKKVEPMKVEAPKKQSVRAVFGRMVDPHTGVEFTERLQELSKVTAWVQAQIDAGKIEVL